MLILEIQWCSIETVVIKRDYEMNMYMIVEITNYYSYVKQWSLQEM